MSSIFNWHISVWFIEKLIYFLPSWTISLNIGQFSNCTLCQHNVNCTICVFKQKDNHRWSDNKAFIGKEHVNINVYADKSRKVSQIHLTCCMLHNKSKNNANPRPLTLCRLWTWRCNSSHEAWHEKCPLCAFDELLTKNINSLGGNLIYFYCSY